jgi:chemotaxis signal transduction protein
MTPIDNPEYWLGMRINGERYALPASSVQSVFLYPESEQSLKDLRISGVVVHEGAPVYLRNHFQLLRFNRRAENISDWQQVLKPGSAPWIVVLKDGPNKSLGFRVNNISGPFHAPVFSDSLFVHHNGIDHLLVEAS